MDTITSIKNPLIQSLRGLSKRAGREESGLFLVEGEVMIREALASGLVPRTALAVAQRADFIRTIPGDHFIVPEEVLRAVCDTKTPQGVCVAFEMPPPAPLDQLPHRIVTLDGVQDPGNVGTIWRTADAAGFQALLLGEGCADPMSPKVQRAAMGSGFRLPYALGTPLYAVLRALKDAGYAIVCAALDGADIYARAPLGEKIVLVIGSEARGISADVQTLATARYRLPMRGGAESLNAAVAAGIMMYELMKDLPME
ncbi:MAG: TrmH family RNA methyltransferase [Christensenellales bacterium]|jgi:TrmH family RNA methyltransferase